MNKRQNSLYWKISTFLFAFCSLLFSFATPAHAASCAIGDPAQLKDIECAFGNAIGVVLGLAGIVIFVTFLIGGFKYLTSGSDPKAVEAAKQTLTAAIAGLIVLVLAYVVLVIIQAATGVQVTQFKVTTP